MIPSWPNLCLSIERDPNDIARTRTIQNTKQIQSVDDIRKANRLDINVIVNSSNLEQQREEKPEKARLVCVWQSHNQSPTPVSPSAILFPDPKSSRSSRVDNEYTAFVQNTSGFGKKERECIKRGEGLVENKRKIEVAGFRVAILWHEIIDRSRAESTQLFHRSNKPMFTGNNKGKADIRRDVCK